MLPQALPGILTGVILGLERAAGETAPILFTGAAFFLPSLPTSPLERPWRCHITVYVISTQVPGMPNEYPVWHGIGIAHLGVGHERAGNFDPLPAPGHTANGSCATRPLRHMDKIVVEHLNLIYSDGNESLKDINLRIPAKAITRAFRPGWRRKIHACCAC